MSPSRTKTFEELASRLLSPIATLGSLQEGISISDPRQEGNPLVYANESFLQLTGYTLQEVINRNCRFLQGPDTDPTALARIRQALDSGTPLTIELLNYRKDGSGFWNQVTISPIRDEQGTITNFIAIQRDVTAYRTLQQELEQHESSVASLLQALQMLRDRVKEQENTIAAFIMHADPVMQKQV
jgi:PAS domain S-box-containing protein